MAGIYAMLFTLKLLLPNKEVRPSLRLACDGKSVLSRLKWLCMTDPQEPHGDLLSNADTAYWRSFG